MKVVFLETLVVTQISASGQNDQLWLKWSLIDRKGQKLTRVGVDQESDISGVQVVDDSGFRKIGHVSHIFKKFVFWRILWFNIFFLFQGSMNHRPVLYTT